MMHKTLRVGFVGAGENTRFRHLPGFAAIEGVELAVVANRSTASAKRVADQFGITRVASDWKAVVADPEVDAVCVGTWPDAHAEITIAALAAGKHVLCEARMAASWAEACRMAEAARAYPDRVLQIVPAPFTLKIDQTLAAALADGSIGNLREIRLRDWNGSLAAPDAAVNWRFNRQLNGINVMTMGIHHESVLRWINDEVRWVQAWAGFGALERLDTTTGERRSVQTPESLQVIGETRAGVRLFYDLTCLLPGANEKRVVLSGDRGSLHVDMALGRATLHDLSAKMLWQESGGEGDGWAVEREFVELIRGQRTVASTMPAEALRYMRFTAAVDQSWQNRSERIWLEEICA